MMELKSVTAALVRGYVAKLAPSATGDCMTMQDHFLVLPKRGKCELVFSAPGTGV